MRKHLNLKNYWESKYLYKQKLAGIDQTIVILANIDFIYEKVEKVKNSYFKR